MAPDGAAPEPMITEAASTQADVDRVKSADTTMAGDVALMLADLPLEKRLHVQGLLADLDSRMDERGLMTIVPGGLLFTVNSEAVQESAHDTLEGRGIDQRVRRSQGPHCGTHGCRRRCGVQ